MSNANDPKKPNGKVIVSVMSPQARKEWLAANNAPKDYHLIHEIERAAVQDSMRRAVILDLDYKAAIRALGDYWKDNPDMTNACAEAVFDAAKYKLVAQAAIEAIRGARGAFAHAAENHPDVVERIDALNAANTLVELLASLTKKFDERRDRTKKEEGA